jgi:hypothetical protein
MFNLHVRYSIAKPVITQPVKPEKKVLNAGEKYQFVCKAEGNPSPWVQWIMNGENRAVTNKTKHMSVFKINEADESHVGNYTCKVWNSLGVVETYFLELKLKPAG